MIYSKTVPCLNFYNLLPQPLTKDQNTKTRPNTQKLGLCSPRNPSLKHSDTLKESLIRISTEIPKMAGPEDTEINKNESLHEQWKGQM